MSRSFQRVRALLLGTGVACALGFGASQALAEPAPPAADSCDTLCNRVSPDGGVHRGLLRRRRELQLLRVGPGGCTGGVRPARAAARERRRGMGRTTLDPRKLSH
jgi:hypothetical protein